MEDEPAQPAITAETKGRQRRSTELGFLTSHFLRTLSHPIVRFRDMKEQLTLIESVPNWHIDHRTITIGRHGLEQARAALASAKRPVADLDRAA